MANYVHNYVFCNIKAKDKLLSRDYDYIYEIAGCYGNNVIGIDNNNCLVLFDTLGSEYNTGLIKGFIEEYNDTKWYCVEENEIEQGFFWSDKGTIHFSKRDMSQGFKGKEICLKYQDEECRPLLTIFISDKKIIFEKILQNERKSYAWNMENTNKINAFMNVILKMGLEDNKLYPIPVNNGINTTMYIAWNNKSLCIESDEEQENLKPDGKEVYDKVLTFFQQVLSDEDIYEDITFVGGIPGLLPHN